MPRRTLHLPTSACLLAAALATHAANLAWTEIPGGRCAPLEVPSQGKVGFTLLDPEQTGVSFTNSLDALASASNRVLEDGSGVAIGDFDRDGRPDIFLCGLQQRSSLFRNHGEWRFEDVTTQSGLGLTNYICRGAVFADLNGDGWPDLLVSTLGRGVRCFINDGQGRFTDKTQQAGTESRFGSMTLALADVDGNGTLDLYVTNYRAEDIRDQSRIEVRTLNGKMTLAPQYQGRLMLAGGQIFEFGEPDILYLNDGHGRFTQVPWSGGSFLDEENQPIPQAPADWGLTATFRDLNADGLPDLYVCNDYWTPDRIWINQGKGKFRLIARHAIRHTSENSMGIDLADLDRDGHVDIMVVDMLSREPATRKRQVLAQTPMPAPVGEFLNRPQIMRNTLFHNRGDDTFEEIADFAGLPASEWSWQPLFLDVDLDGYEDLLIPAGHTRDVQDLDATKRIQSLQHPWPKEMTASQRQQAFTREMAEHAKLYPPLPLPILAFRNLGNLRFDEATSVWGTQAPGVHQGTAYGDLDGDGDLDLVVNNLNSACGVYRNECTAPRVAIRLRGLPPNTAGIGSRIRLRGGNLPLQSQEVVSGGRYMSSCEPILVFAAGVSSGAMTLEVDWRSGRTTTVTNVRANQLYEIDEPTVAQALQPGLSPTFRSASPASAHRPDQKPRPVFADVSRFLRHRHTENQFDEAARQPLLPKRLSQLGPGIAWYDLDSDGHDDLLIGSGAGGHLAIFRNDGKEGFVRSDGPRASRDQTTIIGLRKPDGQNIALVGEASYEDSQGSRSAASEYSIRSGAFVPAIPGTPSSVGPLALADLDGDGVLELFVGGRVIPGRYPEPASSQIYRQNTNGWRLDEDNSRPLSRIGLVSGAIWSDLDADGFPELILACEWGPIRIFENRAGHLADATASWSMNPYSGWWNGIATGDFDGDGKLDIVAGNWGLNSQYHAAPAEPLKLYYGNLKGLGEVDLIETEYDPIRKLVGPRHRLDIMARALPSLRSHFGSFRAFSEATIDQLLAQLNPGASAVEARTLVSTVFLNRGNHFEAVELPREAQLAPVFGVTVADFDGDGFQDLFLAQNFFALPWEQPRLDAGRGLLLRGDGTGHFVAVPGEASGIEVYGEQRGSAAADFNRDGRTDLALTQNGAETKLYLNQAAAPGLRIRLAGPAGNPTGVGAAVQLRCGDHWGPISEVHAGSGYWSQDSTVLVLSSPTPPSQARVRWPGGRTSIAEVPAAAKELRIDF